MQIRVNGEGREVSADMTVLALIEDLGLGGKLVAVERNGVVVPKAAHGATELSEGDELEVVHFVGGG